MLDTGLIINDRYQLQQRLGDNSISVTWLATDLLHYEPVVIKLLSFGDNVSWEKLKLFEREAKTLQLLNHPQIPKFRDYFSLNKVDNPQNNFNLGFALVLEYIPGSNLKELLNQQKKFTTEEVKSIATQVLEILHYLHELNPPVYHRDIKPSNLIMGDDGKIYLVDFGAVQAQSSQENVSFTIVGTYGYAPMEQFSSRAIASTDLYALGATLIHLVTGIAPSELPTKELKIQFRDLTTGRSQLDSWLEKMTQPIPEKRFPTAISALKGLELMEVEGKSSYSLVNFATLAKLLIVVLIVGVIFSCVELIMVLPETIVLAIPFIIILLKILVDLLKEIIEIP